MKDEDKTREQLIKEVAELRQRIDELRLSERKKAEDALRASEEHSRLLIESSQDCICHISLDGKYLDMNAAGCGINELHSLDDVIGKSCTESIIENRDLAEEAIRRAAEGETVSLQYRSINKAGKKIWWDSKVTPVKGADGAVKSILRISRDITERKRMEEEFLKVNKLESVSTLSGGIAHDFNNILTIILGKISLAKMLLNQQDETFEILGDAEKGCKRAKELTNQLLTFSKGGAPIKKTASILEIVRESIDFALRGSNVRCDLSVHDDLWPVEVDEGQMSQVINNLFINAVQAMPAGGTINVRTENVVIRQKDALPLKDGKYVKISIKDQGVGIPKEHLQRIFDPFFTTKQSGSGLGLATTYSIVRKHDGYITVESELGVGTTFHIYLLAAANEIEIKTALEDRPVVGYGRVLIMDDEEVLRESTRDLLEHIGYDVETVADGAEAVNIYRKAREAGAPFDVVIMDLTIPGGMGGKDAIIRLLEIDPYVKAIVSSGYSNDPVMAAFREYGFSGVVSKPYKIEELGDVLQKVMRESRSEG